MLTLKNPRNLALGTERPNSPTIMSVSLEYPGPSTDILTQWNPSVMFAEMLTSSKPDESGTGMFDGLNVEY